MNIIEISSECSGLAQRGGLGSVLWGIGDAFRRIGHETTIVMPYYAEIRHEVHLLTTLDVVYGGEKLAVSIFEAMHFGIRVLLIHHDRFFRGEYEDVYIDSSKLNRGFFEDDARRFAFFSVAACTLLLYLQNREAVAAIHCHDWHTGLVPLLIKIHPAFYSLRGIRCVFTIHNLEYQGTRPFAAFGHLRGFLDWFPELADRQPNNFAQFLDPDADIPCINPMRAAINASDHVTTVSPTYAEEICRADIPEEHFFGGRGLEKDLSALLAEGRLTGITNGIDQEFYDPQKLRHPYLPRNRAEGKKRNRAALLEDLSKIIENMVYGGALLAHSQIALREKTGRLEHRQFMKLPLFVAVTRMTEQKINQFFAVVDGKTVLEHLSGMPLYLIFLGKGNLVKKLMEYTAAADNILFFAGFDDDLEKRLYASADCLLMPSDFEPCGTSQMKAMRYGCLPIASAVGGLKDTIRDGYNGFLFSGSSHQEKTTALLSSIETALRLYEKDKQSLLQMQKNAMRTDFSWKRAAENYLRLLQPND